MRVENTAGSQLECFSATMALLNLLRHRLAQASPCLRIRKLLTARCHARRTHHLAQGDRSPQTMEICRQLGTPGLFPLVFLALPGTARVGKLDLNEIPLY